MRFALSLSAALVLGFATFAGRAQTAAQPAPKALAYVAARDVQADRLMPPPFPYGSPRAAAELQALHRTLAAASPARLAQAKWDDDHEDPSLFAPTLEPAWDLAALPQTASLLAVVQNDSEIAAGPAKRRFPSKRPWAADPSIATCDPSDKPLTSYPSGHATLGYSLAMTLALALPERATVLMERASDYAYSREVCGSHYASDTQASQALAAALVTALDHDPEFRSRLAAVRSELKARGF